MVDETLSSKIKNLAILSDKNMVKILCALSYFQEIGETSCVDDNLAKATSMSEIELTKFGQILKETNCVEIENKEIGGRSPHDVYTITEYGKSLLKKVGIDSNVIRNEIDRND